MLLHGRPNVALPHVFVIMPVDASGSGHVPPWNFGMPRFHRCGQPPRRLRNDLKRPHDAVKHKLVVAEALVLQPFNEAARKGDVLADVKKDTPSDSTV
jgi:hypothetical protein